MQVTAAQQYNMTMQGYDPLRQWVKAHTNNQHHPPSSGQHDVLITNGNNHTVEVCSHSMLSPLWSVVDCQPNNGWQVPQQAQAMHVLQIVHLTSCFRQVWEALFIMLMGAKSSMS